MTTWVITCRRDYASTDPAVGPVIVQETSVYYRGSEAECLRIKAQLCRGSDDCSGAPIYNPIVGPAADWDAFLAEMSS